VSVVKRWNSWAQAVENAPRFPPLVPKLSHSLTTDGFN